MKYLIPYLLVFLTVFRADFLYSQDYIEVDYTEIDSLISCVKDFVFVKDAFKN